VAVIGGCAVCFPFFKKNLKKFKFLKLKKGGEKDTTWGFGGRVGGRG
jgi:hypothetical protein